MKGEQMPVKKGYQAPSTIVKQLRELTRYWDMEDESYRPSRAEAVMVKDLVDKLPSFRAAPQTKLETTLRSIEVVISNAVGVNLQKEPLPPPERLGLDDLSRLVQAVALILNIHHGVKPEPKPKPKPKKVFHDRNGYVVSPGDHVTHEITGLIFEVASITALGVAKFSNGQGYPVINLTKVVVDSQGTKIDAGDTVTLLVNGLPYIVSSIDTDANVLLLADDKGSVFADKVEVCAKHPANYLTEMEEAKIAAMSTTGKPKKEKYVLKDGTIQVADEEVPF